MKRFALISTALPPAQSGQSTVLFHLLKDLDPNSYCLITQKNIHQYRIKPGCSVRLSANYHFLGPDYQVTRILAQVAVKIKSVTILRFILKYRTWQIKKVLRKEHCEAVVVCTSDLFDPPAAFFASRELGIPLIFYAFDYYSGNWTDPFLRAFGARYEPDLVRGAVHVIVPNECLLEEYRKQFGITATVIHNPFDIDEYEKNIQAGREKGNESTRLKTIVYTGAVYDAHYDAFRNLIAAIKTLGMPELSIHLYTPQSERRLLENGITGPVVLHKAQAITAIPAIQQEADILFLPLSIRSPYPDMVKTSAPGKMGEYLASKRPILVHAPKDSFVAWYFRKYQCGLVVDDDDPKILAVAVARLLQDKELRKTITENAYERAKIDFDLSAARKKFMENIVLAEE
jgi:glycosyltransferase involved in cell wall biosynthesis